MLGRQGKTALKICGAASVVATAWIFAGLSLNDYVMDKANEKERELARQVNWNNKELPLHAFDLNDPNNKKWAQDTANNQQGSATATSTSTTTSTSI